MERTSKSSINADPNGFNLPHGKVIKSENCQCDTCCFHCKTTINLTLKMHLNMKWNAFLICLNKTSRDICWHSGMVQAVIVYWPIEFSKYAKLSFFTYLPRHRDHKPIFYLTLIGTAVTVLLIKLLLLNLDSSDARSDWWQQCQYWHFSLLGLSGQSFLKLEI